MHNSNPDLQTNHFTLTKNTCQNVSLVIPAYKEELVIGSVVLKAKQYIDHIIVVDDGSPDRTGEIAALAGADVIRLEKNMGKAHALLTGLRHARDSGSIAALMIDGDGQHKTREIPDVLTPVLQGKADLCIGSRFLTSKNNVPSYRKVGQKILNGFSKVDSRHKCTDSQSGFRAMSRRALENLDFSSSGYAIESDMISHFLHRGLKIMEVPINVRYEVPHKHKMNPFLHGASVLARIVTMISYRRPLLAFGIPGVILFVVGVIISSYAFAEYYSSSKFPFTMTLGSVTLLILGMLLFITGLILNALVIIMGRGKFNFNDK